LARIPCGASSSATPFISQSSALRGAIRETVGAQHLPGAGADEDERALALRGNHCLGERLGDQERRAQIDVHDAVPHLDRRIEQPAKRVDAGVVDHDIGDRPIDDLPAERRDGVRVGQFGGRRANIGAARLCAERRQAGVVAVGQKEPRAGAGEILGQLRAVNPRRAGDHHVLAGKFL